LVTSVLRYFLFQNSLLVQLDFLHYEILLANHQG
jgi:hypothetical protein